MAISVAIFPPWIKVHFCIKIKIRITLILKYVIRFFFFNLLPFIYGDDGTGPIISMT